MDHLGRMSGPNVPKRRCATCLTSAFGDYNTFIFCGSIERTVLKSVLLPTFESPINRNRMSFRYLCSKYCHSTLSGWDRVIRLFHALETDLALRSSQAVKCKRIRSKSSYVLRTVSRAVLLREIRFLFHILMRLVTIFDWIARLQLVGKHTAHVVKWWSRRLWVW